MTTTLKAGDTVWTVDGEWIQNFDDDYYAIKIPTYVRQHTVKEYYTDKSCGYLRHCVTTTEESLYVNSECNTNYYLTEDEALKALREGRKQFMTNCPNDWKKIVKELQQLIEEQSK